MRALIEDIVYDRTKGPALLRFVLRALSVGFRLVVSCRNFLYTKQLIKSKDVACRVVSIGNLTVGGTSKTPVVIKTVELLQSIGCSVAVVSRGYKRKGSGHFVVSDGESFIACPEDAGDEPHIIASSLTGVPVVVGKDRYRAAEYACSHFRPDVIVLDDAFQHRRLFRNVDVVTLDAENPYGNGHLLPRGILRESPRELSRAKAVIVTNFHDGMRRDRIERMVRYYDRKVPIFYSTHKPKGLRPAGNADDPAVDCTGTSTAPESLNGARITAMSNIACPESFRRTLTSLGADIIHHHIMADHHRYTQEELEHIERDSIDAGASMLVMTAKDERNFPENFRFNTLQAFVLDIEAELMENHDDYLKIVAPYSYSKKMT